MGTFSVTIELGSPDRHEFRRLSALVDTGATFTWVPRSILEDLGHKPTRRRQFELADGRIIECDMDEVPIRIEGEQLTTICIFADEGNRILLGAVTLEQFLLAPDPIKQKLVPIVGLAANLGRER